MLEKKLSLVISFKKTIDAMTLEEYAIKNSIEGRLIPLPKEISAGCGLAWKCSPSSKDDMIQILSKLGIDCDKMNEILI